MIHHITRTHILSHSERNPLAAACVAGLLVLGLAGNAFASPVGGQGGAGGNSGNAGGSSGSGGGGGSNTAPNGSPSTNGNGGTGGNGAAGGLAGAGGLVGSSILATSTVTTATTGANGSPGGTSASFDGGGAGGGGDGVYAAAGITITNQSTITGGGGGKGGTSGIYGYGGGGGGGGNGVAFNGLGTLINQGTISGGYGGNGGYYGGGGGGGGNGVVGLDLTITNSGTISGGAPGNGANNGTGGTAGDAILFLQGSNSLHLLTGSVVTGNIEVAGTFSTATIAAQSGGLTLSTGIIIDANSSYAYFDTSTYGLTVSGTISGSGGISESGSNTLVLTGMNSFTGSTKVNSGTLQLDGSIGAVLVNRGTLSGTGTAGPITLSSSSTIAPGDGVGTLNGFDLVWNGGGGFNFQLGSSNAASASDLLALTGALSKGNPGKFIFHFTDGIGAPTLGTTYTLVTFASQSGFTASDFSYDYSGANPSLVGTFSLTPTALTFTASALPVRLQSYFVD